jgi:hypothetical protein
METEAIGSSETPDVTSHKTVTLTFISVRTSNGDANITCVRVYYYCDMTPESRNSGVRTEIHC